MKKRMTLTGRRSLVGIAFVSPFILGLIMVFFPALIKAFTFSISDLNISPNGYAMTFAGIDHYKEALFVDKNYVKNLVSSVTQMLINIPLVLVFSFFISTVLNMNFKGRAVVRSVLFLPVIVSAGVLVKFSSVSIVSGVLTSNATSGSVSAVDLSNLLVSLGLPAAITTYLAQAVSQLYEVINSSGVQVLIFLAALQTISPSIYEAATMDGATGWEKFWKITFPMLSPYILTNTVYSIVDLISSSRSAVLNQIVSVAQSELNYSLSTAMAFMFFIVLVVILAIFVFLISRLVFYYD